MTTFDDPRFLQVLSSLEAKADASDAAARARFMAVSETERAGLMQRASEDPRAFYTGFAKDLFLAVEPHTRRLLYALGRASRARTVVEFGTSFGLSTLFLAAAVRDNGGGRVVATEFEPGKAAAARATFEAAGVADLIDLREGDATVTLAHELPGPVELVLLDGAKPLYRPVLELLRPHLRAGALVLADNVDDAPDYARFVRDAGRLSVPVSDSVELTVIG